MVRLFAFALATTALAGAVVALPEAPATAQTAPAGKPQYGASASTLPGWTAASRPATISSNMPTAPGLKNTPIPADKSRYGMFNVLDDLSRERTRTIIEEQSKDPNSRIGNAYASFMDEAAIEAKGLTPLQPVAQPDPRGQEQGRACRSSTRTVRQIGVSAPFRMFVGSGSQGAERYMLSMSQGGLGMPDRDYYLSSDPKLAGDAVQISRST